MKYYKDKFPLANDPDRASIFRIQTTKSDNFYLRVRREDKSGYFQRSLGTPNRAVAMKEAEKIWLKFRTSEAAGIKFTRRKNFNQLFSKFVDEYGFTEVRKKKLYNNFRRYYSEFFSEYSVNQVNSKLMLQYFKWRQQYWRTKADEGAALPPNYTFDPSVITLRGEKNEIVQFLNWCAEEDYLPHAVKIYLPRLMKKRMAAGVRLKRWGNAADQSQLNQFQKKLYQHFGKSKTFRDELCVRRVYYFIAIIRNCNIRPGTEATRLLWRDISFQPSKEKPGQTIPVIHIRSGKVGERYAIGALGSEKYFHDWRIWLQKGALEEHGIDDSYGEDYDHVFPHFEGGPCDPTLINLAFKRYLRKWKLEHNKAGLPISLYSIRSSEINKMITETQWPVGKIAAAFGTSIEQISKAYHQEFMKVYADRYADKSKQGSPDWNLPDHKLEVLEQKRQLLEQLGQK